MNLSLLHRVDFVSMLMVKAVQARFSRIDKATRQLMVFGAVMELDIPTDGDEQHHKCHQTRADLQQPLFHGTKIQKKTQSKLCLVFTFNKLTIILNLSFPRSDDLAYIDSVDAGIKAIINRNHQHYSFDETMLLFINSMLNGCKDKKNGIDF